jgi:hypothetical protein
VPRLIRLEFLLVDGMQVTLSFLRRTIRRFSQRQEVPDNPEAKLQGVYDKVLRSVGGRSRPVREVAQLLAAYRREAFGADRLDIPLEEQLRVAEELAAGRRVVVMDGHLRFEDGTV